MPRNPKAREALKLPRPNQAASQDKLHAMVLRQTAGRIEAPDFSYATARFPLPGNRKMAARGVAAALKKSFAAPVACAKL
jgi:hypothetical protein